MKKYDRALFDKKILMLSDYVDPASYTIEEYEEEQELINRVENDIKEYDIDYKYIEIKETRDLEKLLNKIDRDNTIIFNWCEEINEGTNSGHEVTKLLEKYDVIYTGPNTKGLLLSVDKSRVKKILIENGISTPAYSMVQTIEDANKIDFDYPKIVKLNDMHGSIAISNDNIVENKSALLDLCEVMLKCYDSKLIVEDFIEGEEFHVPVWGNDDDIRVLPITKIHFKDELNKINTYEAKFVRDSLQFNSTLYELVPEADQQKYLDIISDEIIQAYKKLHMRDYGRFEIRIKDNRPFILDANPNPMLYVQSALFDGAHKLGYNMGETILKICEHSLLRNN